MNWNERQMNYDKIIYDLSIANGYNPEACRLIAAHARMITNDYKSKEFEQTNNLFGLRFVNQPLATKGVNGLAKYETVENSVLDLVTRLYAKTINDVHQSKIQDCERVDSYANLLKNRYFFSESEYIYANKIRSKLFYVKANSIVKEINTMTEKNKPTIVFSLVTVAAIVGYLTLT